MKPSAFDVLLVLALLLPLTACEGRPAGPSQVVATLIVTESPVPEKTREPLPPLGVPSAPAVPEQRLLSLDYPAFVRMGDAERVYLTLQVDSHGNLTPTARVGGNIVQGEAIEIPNIYETHHLWAEARLDLAGMVVQPAELVSETMFPGQTISFFWSIQPQTAGKYKGTVWLYLRFIPKEGGAESRRALSAQLIEIEAVTFYGLKADTARWLGLAGTTLSAVVGFPFLKDIVQWLLSRQKKRQKQADAASLPTYEQD